MKISIIGAGNIGGALTFMVMQNRLVKNLVLYDINENIAKGKALDIMQSAAIYGSDIKIKGTAGIRDISNSNVVVVTAGVPRKPGMSRDDLISVNSKIVKSIARDVKIYSPDAFVILATNPLDSMVYLFHQESQMPSAKVLGMAGVLDAGRMTLFLSEEFKVSAKDIQVLTLGGHGDLLLPLIGHSTIKGISLNDMVKIGYSSQEKIEEICQRTRLGGGEIVELLGFSAYFAPAASIFETIKAFLWDSKSILPCAAYLTGEYDVNDLYAGVPVVIGKNGAESIIELKLSKEEKKHFSKSIALVQKAVNLIKDN